MSRIVFQQVDTPVGKLLVAGSAKGLCRICFPNDSSLEQVNWFKRHFSRDPQQGSLEGLEEAIRQLGEYFQGRREVFRISLDLRGTAFQNLVWEELLKIPYGQTSTYGQVAGRVGNPRACQAVGSAVGRNPVPIVVPCHRVVGHDGSLVGFGGGLATKEKLLKLEGVLPG